MEKGQWKREETGRENAGVTWAELIGKEKVTLTGEVCKGKRSRPESGERKTGEHPDGLNI